MVSHRLPQRETCTSTAQEIHPPTRAPAKRGGGAVHARPRACRAAGRLASGHGSLSRPPAAAAAPPRPAIVRASPRAPPPWLGTAQSASAGHRVGYMLAGGRHARTARSGAAGHARGPGAERHTGCDAADPGQSAARGTHTHTLRSKANRRKEVDARLGTWTNPQHTKRKRETRGGESE